MKVIELHANLPRFRLANMMATVTSNEAFVHT